MRERAGKRETEGESGEERDLGRERGRERMRERAGKRENEGEERESRTADCGLPAQRHINFFLLAFCGLDSMTSPAK